MEINILFQLVDVRHQTGYVSRVALVLFSLVHLRGSKFKRVLALSVVPHQRSFHLLS